MKTPRQRLRTAIESFLYRYPMFANIVLKWELVEVTDRPTMATDGKRLFYNPAFVTENTLEENTWVILHEAGHVFLGHHIRLIEGLPGIRNIAFDLALNELIKADCPTDRLLKALVFVGKGDFVGFPFGKDAETYYRLMINEQSPQNDQSDTGSQDPCPDTETESGNATDEPGEKGEQPGETSDSEGQNAQGDAPECPINDSGSPGPPGGGPDDQNAFQGQPGRSKGQRSEPSDIRYEGLGEVLPSPDMEDKAAAEGQWQGVVAESMALGEMCGNCPGWFKALGERLLGKSEIDWKQVLRQFLTKASRGGFTYSRPSRRNSYRRDVILPCNRSRRSGAGAIIVDTSGSIFSIVREKVLPEISKIIGSIPNPSVRVMQVDTQVTADKTYGKWDLPLKIDIMGGGGTDLNPALKAIAKTRGEVKYLIIVSDMIWAWTQAINPHIPTLWIVIGQGFTGKVPFGRVVKVKE